MKFLLLTDWTRLEFCRSTGEHLPFSDAHFDIVSSANVLEHTNSPEQVLVEAVRVLKVGGILHFELLNYLSYFEGHYMVVQPPILCRGMLPAWIRFVMHRDPAFARTLQTQINPVWCRRMVRRLNRTYEVHLLSNGSDIFLERLAKPFGFETAQVADRMGKLIAILQHVNVGNWVGHAIVAAQGFYPIYLTLRRER